MKEKNKAEVKSTKVTKVTPVGSNILVSLTRFVDEGPIKTVGNKSEFQRNGTIIEIGSQVDTEIYKIKRGNRVLISGGYVPVESPNEEGKILHKDISEKDFLVIIQPHDIKAILE